MTQWVERLLGPALLDEAPRDHRQSDAGFRRRRIVAAATLAVGAVLLGFSLATEPGDPAFYPLTLSVALVWVIGGVLSGPLHLGRQEVRGRLRRPFVTPIVVGLVSVVVFAAGAAIVREIGPVRDVVADVLDHARRGNLALVFVVTLANGVAEEIFFRGALYAAVGRRHAIAVSVAIYVVVTVATANPMLVLAALLMGTVWTLQRRASGGIAAPMLTHVVWSVGMLLALPPIIGR